MKVVFVKSGETAQYIKEKDSKEAWKFMLFQAEGRQVLVVIERGHAHADLQREALKLRVISEKYQAIGAGSMYGGIILAWKSIHLRIDTPETLKPQIRDAIEHCTSDERFGNSVY